MSSDIQQKRIAKQKNVEQAIEAKKSVQKTLAEWTAELNNAETNIAKLQLELQSLIMQEEEEKRRNAKPVIVSQQRTKMHTRLGDAIRSLNIPEQIKEQHLAWIDGTDDNDNGTKSYTIDNLQYTIRNSRTFRFAFHECYADVTVVNLMGN